MAWLKYALVFGRADGENLYHFHITRNAIAMRSPFYNDNSMPVEKGMSTASQTQNPARLLLRLYQQNTGRTTPLLPPPCNALMTSVKQCKYKRAS